ncbi:MAG: S49 family peptidase [Haloferacaceae archaeon]
MSSDRPSQGLTDRQQLVAVVLVAAMIGMVFAPITYDAATGTPDTVAVVEIEGPIESNLADDVEQELSDIRQNDSVEAVVLKIDTGGGAPVASERMYTSIKRTAQEMPVVASVQGSSASGGYYAMLPADRIYVLPTSITGSVGLAAGAPEASPPVEGPSGPDKRGGNEIEGWARQQTLADTFINTVMEERGEEIQLSRSEVAHADVYLGTEAVQNGFADEIGSLDAAVQDAAQRAGLEEYQVDTRETGTDGFLPFLVQTDDGIVAIYASDPGYGEVQPMEHAYVYEESVPHIDTVEQFTRDDVDDALAGESGGEGADDAGDAAVDDAETGDGDGSDADVGNGTDDGLTGGVTG